MTFSVTPRICNLSVKSIFIIYFRKTDAIVKSPVVSKNNANVAINQRSTSCSLLEKATLAQCITPIPSNSPVSSSPTSSSNKKKSPGRPKKKQRSLDPVFDKCMEDYVLGCCDKHCLWDFSFNLVLSNHVWYSNQSEADSLHWLSGLCSSWWYPDMELGKVLRPKYNGQVLCEIALCRFYGFSLTKLESAKNTDPTYISLSPLTNNQNAVKTANQNNMFCWLKQFFEDFGDHMPNSDQIHMPSYCSRKRLYATYEAEMLRSGIRKRSIGSESTFIKFMKKEFTNIRFPRKTRLARCNFCTSINSRRLKCTTEDERSLLKDEIDLHLTIAKTERITYHERRNHAMRNSRKIASLIIDGSEKIKLPNIVPIPKQLSRAKVLEVGVVGTICHNLDRKTIYLTPPDFPKGSELNISILFQQISTMLSFYDSLNYDDNSNDNNNTERPSILFLQMDNGSENKNRWMFGFLSMLIYWEWFIEINVYFLQPGHTHEDVDQMFSRISTQLDKHTIGSIPSLITALTTSSSTVAPSVTLLPAFMKWSTYFAPHLKNFTGHGECYAYIFRKQPNGLPGMKMKLLASSVCWQGLDSSPEDWIELFQTMPSGYPQLVIREHIKPEEISDLHKFDSWLTVQDSLWLNQVKNRQRIQNYPLIDFTWNKFDKFKLQYQQMKDSVQIQHLIGNGPSSFIIRGSNSLSYVEIGSFTLQTTPFQIGQLVV